MRSSALRKVERMEAIASSHVYSQDGSKWVLPIINSLFMDTDTSTEMIFAG